MRAELDALKAQREADQRATAAVAPEEPLSPTATSTASPTRTSTSTSTPIVTPTPTATLVVVAAAIAPPEQTSHWDWPTFFVSLAVVVLAIAAIIVFISRRRVAVWKGQSHA